ncbi:hypothetical protein C8R47DRAFT_1162553 [Mycena vitilis]|nr:hypothetical protein C8R47DRAFT_1162553 [Mycena vitilis]
MPKNRRAAGPRRAPSRQIIMARFASSAEEVRANPRAIRSISPRRASTGHKCGQDSDGVSEPSRGQCTENKVSEPCHAGHKPDTGTAGAALGPTDFGAPKSTIEPRQATKNTAAIKKVRLDELASIFKVPKDLEWVGGAKITGDSEEPGPTTSKESQASRAGESQAPTSTESQASPEGPEIVVGGAKMTWRRIGPSSGSGGQGRCSGGSISV